MPKLIVAILAAAGIWFAYKWLSAPAGRIGDEHGKRQKMRAKSSRTLKQDPKTGIYKPEDD